MILDSLDRHELYLSPKFKKGFDFLVNNDLKSMPVGKYELEGEDVFVIVMEYTTKEIAACKLEGHRKYIDIQYMITGSEKMGHATLETKKEIDPYSDENDVAFFEPVCDSMIEVNEGQFTIFYPHDLHMPCIAADRPMSIKKAVVKIRY